MQSIFNSLGSNYNSWFVLLALKQLFFGSKRSLLKLSNKLEEMFAGKVFLFYKGRDAIEFILKAYDIGPGDQVLTQAFTCCAIEEAIQRTDAEAVYVDLAKDSFNPSVATLNQALKQSSEKITGNKKAKAVIIQHTLGHPAEIIKIKKWCIKNNLILIEDLAQALGGLDADGKPLGTHADAVILSFGRDKIIDAIAGGAAIFKSPIVDQSVSKSKTRKVQQQASNLYQQIHTASNQINKSLIIKEMLYPFFTDLIRFTYDYGIGKILHLIFRKLNLLGSPIISPTKKYAPMPAAYAALALYQFNQLNRNLNHRRNMAQIYLKELKNGTKPTGSKKLKLISDKASVQNGSNLRFAITIDDPQGLSNYLTAKKVYLADRWYRQAVDCGKLSCNSVYQAGVCPNAELLAQIIFNLPTHRFVKASSAAKIINLVNNWLAIKN